MAFNKSKALENALKFLNQGKVAQAIGEYQLILRADPKDQATLMTVGDLFARQADMTQAIEYFERLAQVYLNDGFNSKAIAIYKKIAKLAPNELAPLERLADLYVQQGVLSEARPLFLQIAEAHLKSNHSQKAVEVLHRLLEVEPENQRVQMRLAELYGMMGQKKEAALTYQAYAHRLFDRGETEEAEKLVERALEVDPGNAAAILLKAKTLNSSEKTDQAIAILSTHPEAETGGDVTKLLVEYELRAGHADKAAVRARRQLAQGHAHHGLLCKVAEAMIEGAQPEHALPILAELRAPMIEAGAQDHFLKSLTTACERLPGRTEPLEALADFCRTTSDPFRLNAALGQLSDAYAAEGNLPRAEELLAELVDRNKNDERLVDRLNQLRARTGGAPMAGGTSPESAEANAANGSNAGLREAVAEEQNKLVPPAPPAIAEEALDEETQRYIAQALTDVDLFSSYGLTQKATHLLENVLQKAPRHTPTLERLLDLHLGAGNDRRTAELAAQLEQIHRERNDTINADRFAELRQRYSKVAGLTEKDLPTAPSVAAPAVVIPSAGAAGTVPPQASTAAPVEPAPFEIAAEPAPAAKAPAPAAAPIEFEIPLSGVEPEEPAPPAPIPLAVEGAVDAAVPAEELSAQIAGIGEELDLSDEWEAIAAETAEPEAPAGQEVPAASVELDPIVEPEPVEAESATATDTNAALEAVFDLNALKDEEPEPEAKGEPFTIEANTPQSEIATHEPEAEAPVQATAEPEIELIEAAPEVESPAEAIPEAVLELVDEPAAAETAATPISGGAEFELELTPEAAAPPARAGAATTEDFISELVAELDDLEGPAAEPGREPTTAAAPKDTHANLEQVFAEANATPMAAITPPPTNGSTHKNVAAAPAATPGTLENLNQLHEVFQEFRSELGEMGEEDEDLETHYNLGIAYREMGLLDEAIGEFQKVAKAVQKGKPFRYEMNCSVMLGLSFMDKGEPKVASLWYQRALQVPGLEEESALALRYDLGLALESAGEADAALDSFRQVYAANIDYRDVADRIATLQKH
jgi:tetratricopeptide (TPR) repeat protein